jgi:Ran GTPase-activating protein (RanGAP) involved in mRNA processing and transport
MASIGFSFQVVWLFTTGSIKLILLVNYSPMGNDVLKHLKVNHLTIVTSENVPVKKEEEFKEFFEIMKENTSLKIIQFPNYDLKNFRKEMKSMLKQNKSLIQLDLMQTNLHHHHTTGFHKDLPLSYLNLSNNKIGNEGLENMTSFLTETKTLKQLHLNNCEIKGEQGGLLVSNILKYNQTLFTFHLSRNPLGVYGGKELVKGIKKNRVIKLIGLTDTLISESDKDLIVNSCQSNKIFKPYFVDLFYKK